MITLETDVITTDELDAFRWRDIRDIGFHVAFWPLHWWPLVRFEREDDRFGGRIVLSVGPIDLYVDYNGYDGPFAKPHGDER